jgi:anti-sigma regulatory factor (Ser/Thr protein kinase)
VCEYTAPARLTLPPRPESVGSARRFLRQRFCAEHNARVVDIAVLLVSELVTNTVRHGTPPVALEIGCDAGHALQVRVSDAGPALPRQGRAEPDDEGGRGLAIVDLLSDDWGVDPGEQGKTVWFTISPDGPASQRSAAD